MARPDYLRPFGLASASMRWWHAPHLPPKPSKLGLGWACSATPFLKPAHSGPETHGTPASVSNLNRFLAFCPMLA
jgi:hypothetical protein